MYIVQDFLKQLLAGVSVSQQIVVVFKEEVCDDIFKGSFVVDSDKKLLLTKLSLATCLLYTVKILRSVSIIL